MCSAELNESEFFEAINQMKTGKTPGLDGLPSEFYKICWQEIKPLFLRMINDSFTNGSIHSNQKKGVLNLIPKGNKDTRFLKNLRPITLLNVDYKIIEKALANRLDNILPGLINADQSGFMAGRRIASNIRKVYDIVQHCRNSGQDAVLLNLDFVKCFDNISFEAIVGSLNYFGIPQYVQTWVKMLYTDFTVTVQNNGKFTAPINVQKSVHQGGCMSVQLFLLCAETIALELRSCKDITGIII